jgi:hypothetical protein
MFGKNVVRKRTLTRLRLYFMNDTRFYQIECERIYIFNEFKRFSGGSHLFGILKI